MSDITAIWALTGFNAHEKIVLLAIADYSNNGIDCPGFNRLASKTGMSKSCLSKTLKILISFGVLSSESHAEVESGKQPNTYTIKLNNLELTQTIKEVRKSISKGTISSTRLPKSSHRLPKSSTRLPVPATKPQPTYFDKFWAAYPTKRGKKPCLIKWKKRNLDQFGEQIIADVLNRKSHDAKWIEGFVPNPETYINQDRWQDEIKAAPVKLTMRERVKADLERSQQRNRDIEGDYHEIHRQ